MKKLIILVFALSICLSPGVSLALVQTADKVSSNVKDIYPKWAAVKKDIDARDFDRAKTGLKEIESMCLDRGITSFEELSAAMVKQGKGLLQAKEMKGALLLFDSAIQISPNYPPPYYARGWAYLSQDKLKALIFVDSFIDGFRNSINDFWWVFFYAGNKFTSILFTLAVLFSLFGLFMAIRYTPLLAHDISESLKNPRYEQILKHFIIPVVFLLVLIALGYWWAVTVSFLALWVYFNKKEKFLSIAFFVILIFMPDIMSYFAGFIEGGGNRLIWVMDEVNKGQIKDGTKEYLDAFIESNPTNEPALMSLAQVQRKTGLYNESSSTYQKLLEINPKSAIYWNNLGNVQFLTGDKDAAIKDYNTAIQLDPKRVLPHFNLSQLYGESLMFTERERADMAARELNPTVVANIRDLEGTTPGRVVFDETISTDVFWKMAFSAKNDALAASFWDTSVKVLPLSGTRVAGVSFIVLALSINAFRKKRINSHYCKKCGKVSCRKCQKPFYTKELCPQCHQIFVKLEGVEAKDRVRKMIEIRETHQKSGLLFRISSLLLPGSGHFLLGHPLRGFIFTGIFIFLIKDIFFGRFFEVPYDFRLPFIQPDLILMGLLLLFFYLLAQLDTHRITK